MRRLMNAGLWRIVHFLSTLVWRASGRVLGGNTRLSRTFMRGTLLAAILEFFTRRNNMRQVSTSQERGYEVVP